MIRKPSSIVYLATIFILFHIAVSQIICPDCLISTTGTTNNFFCNNIGCSGFIVPTSTQYLFNQSSVMCSRANGANGGSNCYYPLASNSNFITYMFCNSTLLGCASCTNNSVCQTCYNGYYLYKESPSGAFVNCQLCSTSIPGCLYCSAQNQCAQCFPGFALINQVCYYFNGTLPNGMNPFTYEKGGSTVAEIIGAVLIFCILTMIAIAVCIFFCKQKKRIPDFMNPALQQASIQESIIYRQ